MIPSAQQEALITSLPIEAPAYAFVICQGDQARDPDLERLLDDDVVLRRSWASLLDARSADGIAVRRSSAARLL